MRPIEPLPEQPARTIAPRDPGRGLRVGNQLGPPFRSDMGTLPFLFILFHILAW
jgi:hypothetical protein